MDNKNENRLLNLEKRVERLEKSLKLYQTETNVSTKMRQKSPKEFLMEKNVETEVHKVLVLGYFLEQIEGVGSFTAADLDAVFRSAKEKPPKNMNDVINRNVARGFLMESKEKKDGKKAWVLTSSGEKFIEENLRIS